MLTYQLSSGEKRDAEMDKNIHYKSLTSCLGDESIVLRFGIAYWFLWLSLLLSSYTDISKKKMPSTYCQSWRPNFDPETHMVEGFNSHSLSSDLHMYTWHMHTHVHTHAIGRLPRAKLITFYILSMFPEVSKGVTGFFYSLMHGIDT